LGNHAAGGSNQRFRSPDRPGIYQIIRGPRDADQILPVLTAEENQRDPAVDLGKGSEMPQIDSFTPKTGTHPDPIRVLPGGTNQTYTSTRPRSGDRLIRPFPAGKLLKFTPE